MESFKEYKQKILSETYSKEDDSVKAFFDYFTRDFKKADSLRFLPLSEDRKLICDYFEKQNPNNLKLYRATYQDRGNIGNAEEGEEVYEPLISCSSDREWCENYLKKLGYNDTVSGNSAQLMLIVFEPGTKNIDVDNISVFHGQNEYVLCGKYKITNKRHYSIDYMHYTKNKYIFDILEVTVQQVFDESFISCFNKMLPIKPIESDKKESSKDKLIVLDRYEKYKKLTIQNAETNRLKAKGTVIDKDFLKLLLSKRIFNNCTVGIDMTYQQFYDIMRKNNCKIYGGKKFGFPEIDFTTNI